MDGWNTISLIDNTEIAERINLIVRHTKNAKRLDFLRSVLEQSERTRLSVKQIAAIANLETDVFAKIEHTRAPHWNDDHWDDAIGVVDKRTIKY